MIRENYFIALLAAFFTLTCMSGCVDPSKIQMRGIHSISIDDVSATGVDFVVAFNIANDTKHTVKMVDFNATISSDDRDLAYLNLRDKVVCRPTPSSSSSSDCCATATVVKIPLRMRMQQLGIMDIAQIMGSQYFTIDGVARVRVAGISRTLPFSERISSRELISIIKDIQKSNK